ncbi:MAG: uncharacterized protein KVP18_002361 [Porospora cf. gigantea A]|nr:MAG: hypothetical protein KVP18_002361 [Porospora cf. gigantea A]
MSKVLYATLFDFGVQLINGKISDPVMEPWVGILDIYGFEFFQKNSFEQFLINYANERLQQYFIQYFFIAEKSELEAEGLDSGVIVYEDNAALLAVMDGKTSVLSLLEDTCLQASGTAETFTNNIHQALDKPGDPKLYVKPKLNSREAFGLAHSAAQVEYNTTEFVVKNKLRMPAAICELFKQSSNSFVRAAFEMVDIPDETKMKGRFTGSIFLREIGSLLVLLRSATPHFIRCMKPNSVLKPQIVEPQMLENQLHALAILQAVDIVQKGYAYRAEFSTFLEENQAIQMILGLAGTGDSRAGTETLLTTLGIDKSQWVLGVSKVYIRKEGWTDVDSKFKTMLSAVVPLVETIQNAYKAFKVRDLARRTLTSQKLLQNGVRRYLSVRDLLTRRKLANFVFGLSLLCCRVSFLPMETEAAIRIQACSRGFLTRKRYANEILRITSRQRIQTLARHIHTVTKTIRWRRRARRNVEERAATGIQALWRGHQGRLQARDAQRQLVLERQCVHIQSVWKGYETRRRVKVLKELHPHITRIQAGWRSYVLRRQIRGRDGERLRDMVQLHRQRRRVQAAARTFHTQVRFSQLHKTGELLQALALPKLLMSQRLSVRWGALTIQAWWRGELVRRRVAASRVRLLVDWKVRQADELTTMESYNGLIFNADGVVIDGKEISVRPRERPDTADVIQLAHDLGKLPCREGLNFLNAKVSVVSVCSRCYPNGLMKTITDISRAHRTGIRQVACGAFHTVVLTLKGHLCVMGISEVLKDRLPTRWRQLETAVPILTVRCGLDFSVAASSSYRLWAWGNNLQGQCGCRPSEAFVSQPTPVLLSSPVSDFSCGAAHSAACGMDGRLHVWGRGSHIGLKATTQDIAAPVALKNLQSAAKVQGGIVGVKCGLGRSYFWTSNGQLFVFGAPRVAGHALGLQGSSLNPNKPARVAGVPPVVTVTCTYYADFALTSSGDIYVWGKLTVTSE